MNEGQSSVRTILLENFIILLHSNIPFSSKMSKKFKILVNAEPHYQTFLGNEANGEVDRGNQNPSFTTPP